MAQGKSHLHYWRPKSPKTRVQRVLARPLDHHYHQDLHSPGCRKAAGWGQYCLPQPCHPTPVQGRVLPTQVASECASGLQLCLCVCLCMNPAPLMTDHLAHLAVSSAIAVAAIWHHAAKLSIDLNFDCVLNIPLLDDYFHSTLKVVLLFFFRFLLVR